MIDQVDIRNQIRGYKATISNGSTSDEAKQHAEERIKQLEKALADDPSHNDVESQDYNPQEYADEDIESNAKEHNNRITGGYKATLQRDNVSDEAKEHARQVLDDAGVEYDEK